MRDFDRAVRALNITIVQINVSVPGQPHKMTLVDLRDDNA